MTDQITTSSGVEKLIEKLRNEGIKAGEDQAQKVMAEAEKKAQEMLAGARAEADEYLTRARADIEKERKGAHEALQLALRDAILEMKERLISRFNAQVRRLIEKDISGTDFLKQLILIVAGRATPPKNERIEILLSSGGEMKNEELDSFINTVSREMLREGVELKPATHDDPGIRVRLSDKETEIDLTDKAISDLILRHLASRFRQIIEGVKR